MHKVLITSVPFGQKNRKPIEILDSLSVDYEINKIGRKLSEDELKSMINDYTILIAGTEPITRTVMENAPELKLISRIGIGLDNVDLKSAKDLGIKVSYTPDAPAPAVSELTIGLMISIMRSIQIANMNMHQGNWNRFFGRRFEDLTIGIIGLGRIGKRVLEHLNGFKCREILLSDLIEDHDIASNRNIRWVDKETIYSHSDLITLHIPLNSSTHNLIGSKEIAMMKDDVMLVNTSRGGIIDEIELYNGLKKGKIASAAIDVFEKEPYEGNLSTLDNCLITSHMGSMTEDCRSRMEVEATEEAARFIKGEKLELAVPKDEYEDL